MKELLKKASHLPHKPGFGLMTAIANSGKGGGKFVDIPLSLNGVYELYPPIRMN